jgi:hypothetical protein
MNDVMYWAKDAPEIIVDKLLEKRSTVGGFSSTGGIFQSHMAAFWRNTLAYYAPILEAESWKSALSTLGARGEIVSMKVAKARTQLRQHASLLSRTRLSYETIVDIDDASAQVTAKLGKNIANHLIESQGLQQKRERAIEWAALLGMSFIICTWRPDKGSAYQPTENDQMLMTGDVNFEVMNVTDVTFDWTIDDWKEQCHVEIRRKRNRFDLIAEVEIMQIDPEEKEKMIKQIFSLPSIASDETEFANTYFLTNQPNEDMVYEYQWFHKTTPSLPQGRIVRYLTRDIILEDAINGYECLPVEPIIFEPILKTGLGYPIFSSLLPAQEMLDHMFSSMATNAGLTALGAILNPEGSGVTIDDIGGMKLINYRPQGAEGGGAPQAFVWPQMSGDNMQFQDRIINAMDEISMLNATLRGQSSANVTSGAMAATLSANAMEFFSTSQQAVDSAFENAMTHAFMAYKVYAKTEQIISINGESSVGYSKQFKADDVKNIKRVKMKQTNPLLTQISGRIQMTESLMQYGVLKDPDKVVQILEGAPMSSIYKEQWTEKIAIQQEIDMIFEGKEVFPLQTDNHPMFISAYREILSSPEFRLNSDLSAAVVQLIMTRAEMEQQLDPMVKALLRGQPQPQVVPIPSGQSNAAQETNPNAGQPQRAEPAQPAQPQGGI